MVEGVEEAIEARGAVLFYLPACSPDFNPIEQFFAKLKSMLRRLPHILSSKRRTPSIV
jgi:transposase